MSNEAGTIQGKKMFGLQKKRTLGEGSPGVRTKDLSCSTTQKKKKDSREKGSVDILSKRDCGLLFTE